MHLLTPDILALIGLLYRALLEVSELVCRLSAPSWGTFSGHVWFFRALYRALLATGHFFQGSFGRGEGTFAAGRHGPGGRGAGRSRGSRSRASCG